MAELHPVRPSTPCPLVIGWLIARVNLPQQPRHVKRMSGPVSALELSSTRLESLADRRLALTGVLALKRRIGPSNDPATMAILTTARGFQPSRWNVGLRWCRCACKRPHVACQSRRPVRKDSPTQIHPSTRSAAGCSAVPHRESVVPISFRKQDRSICCEETTNAAPQRAVNAGVPACHVNCTKALKLEMHKGVALLAVQMPSARP